MMNVRAARGVAASELLNLENAVMSLRNWVARVVLVAGMAATFLLFPATGISAGAQPSDIDAWAAKIKRLAPGKPTVPLTTARPHKALVFSLATGYQHTVIPFVDRMLEIVGQKAGVFQTTVTRDIEDLEAAKLAQYDLLILNNNCSVGPRRNLFLDVLESAARYKNMSGADRQAKSDALENAILAFVRGGHGLVVIHGAPTLLNNSPKFTAMVGGAFDYHPPNQMVTVRVVEPSHPLLEAFHGKDSFVHRDEPYCFKGTYDKLDFRPLLVFDASTVKDKRGKFSKQPRYSAWIKPYGKGRVFYCSPSHFAMSYENPTLLRFVLDGIQYAAGDLKCDDSTP